MQCVSTLSGTPRPAQSAKASCIQTVLLKPGEQVSNDSDRVQIGGRKASSKDWSHSEHKFGIRCAATNMPERELPLLVSTHHSVTGITAAGGHRSNTKGWLIGQADRG